MHAYVTFLKSRSTNDNALGIFQQVHSKPAAGEVGRRLSLHTDLEKPQELAAHLPLEVRVNERPKGSSRLKV